MRSRASADDRNHEAFMHSARRRPWNEPREALSAGLPGRETSISTPFKDAHGSSMRPANPGPLPTQRLFGRPEGRTMMSNTSVIWRARKDAPNLHAARTSLLDQGHLPGCSEGNVGPSRLTVR